MGVFLLVTETAPATAPSTDTAPPSDIGLDPTSLNADAGAPTDQDDNQPNPADDEDAGAPAPKPLSDWSLDELNAKALEKGLTPDEIRRQNDLQRAENNRNRDLANLESQRETSVKSTVEKWTKAPETFSTAVADILTEHEIELPRTAVRALKDAIEKEVVDLYRSGAHEPLLEAGRIEVRKLAVDMGFDLTPTAMRNIGQMDLAGLMEFQREIGRAQGQQEGLSRSGDKDHVLVPKKEWDAYQKAQENEKKAAAGDKVPPARKSTAVATGSALTQAAFMAMSRNEQAQVLRERPDEVNALMKS